MCNIFFKLCNEITTTLVNVEVSQRLHDPSQTVCKQNQDVDLLIQSKPSTPYHLHLICYPPYTSPAGRFLTLFDHDMREITKTKMELVRYR